MAELDRHIDIMAVHTFRPVLGQSDMDKLEALYDALIGQVDDVDDDESDGPIPEGMEMLRAIVSPYRIWKEEWRSGRR